MIRSLLMFVAALVFMWIAGFVAFGMLLPQEHAPSPLKTDAIVVLTGGNKRINVALHLMEKHMAKKLFISGVHQGVAMENLLSLYPQFLVDTAHIELGYASNTTIENAQEVREWMYKNGYGSLRLVTSHYHMPRSLLEMRMLLGNVLLIPHPVLSERFSNLSWWSGRNRTIVFNEYNKYLEALGRFVVNRIVSEFK